MLWFFWATGFASIQPETSGLVFWSIDEGRFWPSFCWCFDPIFDAQPKNSSSSLHLKCSSNFGADSGTCGTVHFRTCKRTPAAQRRPHTRRPSARRARRRIGGCAPRVPLARGLRAIPPLPWDQVAKNSSSTAAASCTYFHEGAIHPFGCHPSSRLKKTYHHSDAGCICPLLFRPNTAADRAWLVPTFLELQELAPQRRVVAARALVAPGDGRPIAEDRYEGRGRGLDRQHLRV